MPFIPHTDDDVRGMLAAIGVPAIDALFDEIPAELRARALDGIPPAASEMQIGRLMAERAARDGRRLNFIGGGAYEHHVPAAVIPCRERIAEQAQAIGAARGVKGENIGKPHGQHPAVRARDSGHEPSPAAPPRDHEVFADLAAQKACLVPGQG